MTKASAPTILKPVVIGNPGDMSAQFNSYGLRFHHLGLAVPSPEASLRFLSALGYEAGIGIEDPLQHVSLIMCRHSTMPQVEIIYPGVEQSPVDRLLQQHRNGLVYHMCFECDDLASTLSAIEQSGEIRLICVSPPKPAILFDGRNVAFYIAEGIGLIEIIDNGAHRNF